MLIIKKATLKKSAFFVTSLALLIVLVALFAPGSVSFAVDATCGDEVCSPTENNDLCPDDCHCNDNGIVEPSEGCGCKDKVCEGESNADLCGVPATNGECPEGLKEHDGVCWDACLCEERCEPEPVCLKDGKKCEASSECCSGKCVVTAECMTVGDMACAIENGDVTKRCESASLLPH